MLPLRTFIALAVLGIGGKPSEQNKNVQEFGVLCQIYAIAKSAAKPNAKQEVQEEEKIVREIDDMYTIAASNETVFEGRKADLSAELKEKCFRATDEGHRRLLAKKFERILNRVEETKGTLREARTGQNAERELIRAKLVEAVFGLGADQVVGKTTDFDGVDVQNTKDATFQSSALASYAKNCGGTGADANNGGFAGISLVNDFICLCVAASGQQGQQCTEAVGVSNGPDPLAIGQIADTQTKWGLLRAACPNFNVRPTPEALEAVLANFHAILGRKAKTGQASVDELARHLLGDASGAATNRCTGNTNGVCVNYKYIMANGGIPWEGSIRAAQLAMEALREKRQEEKSLIRRMRTLAEQARDLCDPPLNESLGKNTSKGIQRDRAAQDGGQPSQNTNQNPIAGEASQAASYAYLRARSIMRYLMWAVLFVA